MVARFDGGQITSDAGALLLRPVEQRTGILRRFAACFRDYRKPELVAALTMVAVAIRGARRRSVIGAAKSREKPKIFSA